MASIFQNPQTRVEKGYNGFDMSKTVTFTSSVGQLLPVFSMLCSPNDKVRYGVKMFSRTQDLETAAFVRIKEHVDYFFVPLTQLFQTFESVRYGIQDLKSSLYDPDSFMPNMQIPWFVYTKSLFDDNDYLGKFDNHYDETSLSDILPVDMFYQPKILNAARLFSLLGVDPTPLERMQLFVQDGDGSQYIANASIEMSANSHFAAGIDTDKNTGDDTYDASLINFDSNLAKLIQNIPASNLLKFAAYQKIWFDCYRLTDYDANDPSYYNLDKYYNTPDLSNNANIEQLIKFFTLRYRPWKKDLFTSIVPSPLFSSESLNSLLGTSFSEDKEDTQYPSDINNWLAPTNIQPIDNTGNVIDANHHDAATTVQFQALNTSNIRAAFAVDRLLDVLRRTPKHYDKMTEAFFGVKPNFGLSGEVLRLGSDTSEINIDQVVSTADTEQSPLGAIGGKGYGAYATDNLNEFTAPCDGIFMAIYSAVPDADYLDTSIDRENTYLDMFDFYNPVMDELGMQPLFNYQLPIDKRYTDGAGYFGSVPGSSGTELLGWQYRYSELKSKYDTVHGGFKYDMSHWVSVRNFRPELTLNSSVSDPARTVSADYELNALTGVGYQFHKREMYINPSYLDSVMLVNDLPYSERIYHTTIADMFKGLQDYGDKEEEVQSFLFQFNRLRISDFYQRDPLLHRFEFMVHKASKMSTYGLPNL